MVSDLVKIAKKYQMPETGICDNGNLFGALEFSIACQKHNIQPIIGCEIFINLEEETNKVSNNLQNNLKKIVLIAKYQIDYLNLMALASDSIIDKKNSSIENISLSDLKNKNEGLIVFLVVLKDFCRNS